MSRVFFPQRAVYRAQDGSWVPKYDTADAERLGRTVEVFRPGFIRSSPESVVIATQRAKEALATFSDEDYLVLMGDPFAIGMCVALAAAANSGRVRTLRWDRHSKSYAAVQLSIFA